MASFKSPALLLLVFVLLLVKSGYAIRSKCSACRAVALELERALENEKPRNSLDMRHRLDSKGQREGRVIQYKYSELRVLELLEDLCLGLKEYILNKGEWSKTSNVSGRSEQEKQEAEALSKDITSYCGRLLDKHEDEIAAAIKNGDMVAGSVTTVLCENLSNACENGEREL